jgi:hypothetical protein
MKISSYMKKTKTPNNTNNLQAVVTFQDVARDACYAVRDAYSVVCEIEEASINLESIGLSVPDYDELVREYLLSLDTEVALEFLKLCEQCTDPVVTISAADFMSDYDISFED